MTTTREDWVGYLLGALDENEQASVERQIAADPRAAQKLERLRCKLHLLSDGLDEAPAPAGLTQRTCALLENPALLAQVTDSQPPQNDNAPQTKRPTTYEALGNSPNRFTLMDTLVAIGACIAAIAIFFPALASSRMLAARMQCENNLRQVGVALHEFATISPDRRYPAIAAQGPLSVAGSYAPRLLEAGFLRYPQEMQCSQVARPAIAQAPETLLPTIDQLLEAPEEQLLVLHQDLSRVYNYNLGIQRDGDIEAPQMRGLSTYPVASDIVLVEGGELQAEAHEDGRLNILFDDGHVEFITLEHLPESMKQYFLNDQGQVAAGLNEDDAVIAIGTARPLGP